MPTRKDAIVQRLLQERPFAGDSSDPRIRYNRRWMFLYYLSGIGMTLYNTYRHTLVIDDYRLLFEHLVRRDGFEIQHDAEVPIYFGEDILEGATKRINLLVTGNIVVMLYRQPTIGDDERRTLESLLTLTHLSYGFIGNFDNDQFYSEWYARDPKTAAIERIRLM